jgi:glycosyltransferase involved in cell wall biosynthesis
MDCLSKGYQRRIDKSAFPVNIFIKSEYSRLAGYEHLIFDYFDFHTIISQQDKSYIFHNESDKIEVIPNGIDKEYFSTKSRHCKYDLLFTGNMSYPPNIEAATILCDKILPLLQVKYPGITLLIAGTNPPHSLQRRANSSITISGWMDDIRDAYDSARIFVAPMWLGSGLQNKLLEAMSMGLPCVTTDLANNALQARPDIDIIIGNSAEAIAAACEELLEDLARSKSIAENGQNYVRTNFSWQGSTEKLMRLWTKGNLNSGIES